MDSLHRPHNFPGKLIIVEGIDGSGKSTQLQLAMRYLQARGLRPFFTEWNSADLVKAVTKRGKKKMSLTPMTFFAPRDGLRAPPRAQHPAAAEGGHDRAGRSVRVHGVRAGRRPGLRPRLGPRRLRLQ